jgi:hypothetical protein
MTDWYRSDCELFMLLQFWGALLFRADDPHNLTQTPPQFEYKTGVPEIKGYRYPTPGSQPTVNLQKVENTDQLYDTKFYARDHNNVEVDVSRVPLAGCRFVSEGGCLSVYRRTCTSIRKMRCT